MLGLRQMRFEDCLQALSVDTEAIWNNLQIRRVPADGRTLWADPACT